jgi:HSP20 family protein
MTKRNNGVRKNDTKPKEIALNSHIARFLQEAAKGFSEQGTIKARNGSMVYGFNLSVGQDGVPKFEVFGNLNPNNCAQDQGQGNVRDHLIDIIDRDNKITVIAEMPGTLRENLTIKASENELIIEANTDGKEYRKTIVLPKAVDPDTASTQLNNGVLEVIFNKAYPS